MVIEFHQNSWPSLFHILIDGLRIIVFLFNVDGEFPRYLSLSQCMQPEILFDGYIALVIYSFVVDRVLSVFFKSETPLPP